MVEATADVSVQTHMRALALARWENEGGASPSRPTACAAAGGGRPLDSSSQHVGVLAHRRGESTASSCGIAPGAAQSN